MEKTSTKVYILRNSTSTCTEPTVFYIYIPYIHFPHKHFLFCFVLLLVSRICERSLFFFFPCCDVAVPFLLVYFVQDSNYNIGWERWAWINGWHLLVSRVLNIIELMAKCATGSYFRSRARGGKFIFRNFLFLSQTGGFCNHQFLNFIGKKIPIFLWFSYIFRPLIFAGTFFPYFIFPMMTALIAICFILTLNARKTLSK